MREWRELRIYFRALADVRRLKMVAELTREPEVSVKVLCLKLRASQPLVSWHLRVLVKSGLVRTRKQGRQVFCSLNRPAFGMYQERLSAILDAQPATGSQPAEDETTVLVPKHPPLSAGL
jgi:ArsR family transcriptional regulator, arsenate/arsenite/antimonite-responsive transcriptional repressor